MKRWRLLIAVSFIVVLVDQLTKQLVIDNLVLGESVRPVPFLEEVFKFTRSYNTGAAFGFLPQIGDAFLILAVIIVSGLIYYYPRIPQHAILTRIATGMVIGGALGNALDRIRHEHVVDFIHYRIPGVISNISNLADHAIVIGVLIIVYDSWRLEKQAKQEETESLDVVESPQEANLPYNE